MPNATQYYITSPNAIPYALCDAAPYHTYHAIRALLDMQILHSLARYQYQCWYSKCYVYPYSHYTNPSASNPSNIDTNRNINTSANISINAHTGIHINIHT